jgi:DNA-binding SARP family transcriptional activator
VNTVLADFEQLFESGKYADAISAVGAAPYVHPRNAAVVGISLLRLGDVIGAEEQLETAMYLGDQEAAVEYGNWLRAVGRIDEAAQHLNEILPNMDGELADRAVRWLGVCSFQSGKTKDALKLLEKAKRGYSHRGDKLSEAKINQNLVAIYNEIGDFRKARLLIEQSVAYFRNTQYKNLLIQSLHNLISVYISTNETENLEEIFQELKSLIGEEISPSHIVLWVSQIVLYEKVSLNRVKYQDTLDNIILYSEKFGISEHLIWGIVKKSEYYLQLDNTSEAMRLIYKSPQDENGQFPTSVRIVRAMINRRMGNLSEAIEELKAVVVDLEAAGNVAELARVRLQLAYALHLSAQPEASADVLRAALQGLLRTNIHPSMRPELEELSELLHFAAMEPSLAPYLEPVMDSLAGVLGGASDGEEGEQVRLQVHTLGRVSIIKGGDPVTFQLKGTVPLLVYLALTPNRTRLEIQNDLYPDKEPDAASSYVRKSIQELRELLGHNAVLTEGPRNHSRYRLGPSLQIDLDLPRFTDAVNAGDMARALALYRGEFLPGSDESEWVMQKRDEARLSLTFELRTQIDSRRETGELRRVILLANQYLKVDPYETEVHELRVEAARKVGTAAELGKYVAAMNSITN